MIVRRALLVLVAAGLAVAACGDDDDTSDAGGLSDARVEVLAIDNAFDPEEVEVEAGTTIVWRNTGRNDHNVVPEQSDASWGIDSADFGPGGEGEHRFTEPGTYRYYCSIHGTVDVGMPGSIVVTEPGDT